MRRTKKYSSFFMCLLVNLILNVEWTVPAWFMLAMHYLYEWPLWLFYLGLGLWFTAILTGMAVIGWAAKCSSKPVASPGNKNPYSKKGNS